MKLKQGGNSQKIAAAQGGFSERSAYNVQNQLFKPTKKKRWKTRLDPFELSGKAN